MASPTTHSQDSRTGEVIADRYRVDGLLGAGGYGAVYRATHLKMGNSLAIKLLHATHTGDGAVVARFEQEARRSSQLRHPNTIRVFDFGRANTGELYIAMEFLSGSALGDVLHEGPLNAKRVVHIGRQVLSALTEAHGQGLIHRDLKPDNVFLTQIGADSDFVKVLDFGIAKTVNQNTAGITQTGMIVGTPSYMSPEQCMGKTIDARSDLYSVGCILYAMLTGRPPFYAEDPIGYLYQHVHEAPVDVREAAGSSNPVPAGLAKLVHKLLSKEPSDRFATAAQALAALETALAGDTTWDFTGESPQQQLKRRARAAGVPDNAMTGKERALTDGKPTRRWVLGAAVSGLALVIGIAAVVATRDSGGPEPVTDTVVSDPATTGQARTVAATETTAEAGNVERVDADLEAKPRSTAKGDRPEQPGGEAAAGTLEGTTGDKKVPVVDRAAGQAVIAEAKQDAASANTGPTIYVVTVQSDPPAAEVLMAGERVGRTPFQVKWLDSSPPPSIELVREGYAKAAVNVDSSQTGQVEHVSLRRLTVPETGSSNASTAGDRKRTSSQTAAALRAAARKATLAREAAAARRAAKKAKATTTEKASGKKRTTPTFERVDEPSASSKKPSTFKRVE